MGLWDKVKSLFGKMSGSETSDLKHLDLDKMAEKAREERKARYANRAGSRDQGNRDRTGHDRGNRDRGGNRHGGARDFRSGGNRHRSGGDDRGPRHSGAGYGRRESGNRIEGQDRGYSGGGRRWGRDHGHHRHGGGGRPPRHEGRGGGGRPWRENRDRPAHVPISGGMDADSLIEQSLPASPAAPITPSVPREERKFLLGTVTNYLPNVQVAIVKVEKGAIQVNDFVAIEGASTKIRQKVTSMQLDHAPVKLARVGQEVGIQVNEAVHAGDQIFRVDGGNV